MGNGYGMGWMSGNWGFGLLALAGLALLVVVLARVVSGGIGSGVATRPVDQAPPHVSAHQILDERYARGDLTTEEYSERIENLGQKA